MSEQNKALDASRLSQNYFLPGFLFALAGLMLHSAFFIGTLVCLTLAMPSRKQRILVAAVSVLFILVSFGYGIGKDMALRDNQAEASSQQKAP